MLCIDSSGRLYAAISHLDITITCIASDGVCIFAGCDDGSIRVYILESGKVREIHRYMNAHISQITCIKVDVIHHILVTSGHDGMIKVWNVYSN